MKKIDQVKKLIQRYYLEDDRTWIIGYSGGKDSSLVIKLVLSAIKETPISARKSIQIMFCDTGVEIPIFSDYISKSLLKIEEECQLYGIDVKSRAVRPKLDNRYFVKVIGRGYPPPTNKFRWCTDKLRIDPIQVALKEISSDEALVVLGTRYEESNERGKILAKYATDKPLIFDQAGHSRTKLFCPIANFSIEEVWENLLELEFPESVDIGKITEIYEKISGECPIVRLPDANPCSKGRFGCWTCTVVRQDKATQNLVKNGYQNLKPLLIFRNWLVEIRDKTDYRCSIRRNGIKGLGPFRLSARQKILRKLLEVQDASGFELISSVEIHRIKELWRDDRFSKNYFEDWEAKHLANKYSRLATARG